MTEHGDQHFSEDEELLGQFVLGHLKPEERQRYDDHLRTCEICRMAVERERTIAAGVKRLGRERLRERLRDATGEAPSSGFPWQRVVEIAAVLVIIIGMGVLYRWWTESSGVKNQLAGRMTNEERVVNAPASRPLEGQRQPSTTALQERREPSIAADDRGAKGGEQPAASGNTNGVSGSVPLDRETEGTRRDKLDQGRSKDAKELLAAAPSQQVSAEQKQQQTWLQGVVSPIRADNGPALGQTQATHARKAKDALAAKKAESAAGAAGNEYSISQRPASALPGPRSVSRVRGTVETLLEEEDHRSRLTLFLDSLFSDEELRQATVEVVTEDSIVVRLRDRTIGYRLPESWGTGKAK